jgi:hypothetical protein
MLGISRPAQGGGATPELELDPLPPLLELLDMGGLEPPPPAAGGSVATMPVQPSAVRPQTASEAKSAEMRGSVMTVATSIWRAGEKPRKTQ